MSWIHGFSSSTCGGPAGARGWNRLLYPAILITLVTSISVRVSVFPFYPELIERFAASFSTLGLLSSGWALGFIVLQIPAGLAADRWHGMALPIAFLLLASFVAIFPLLTSLTFAVADRVLMGAAAAFIFPSIVKFTAEYSPAHRRGIAMGLLEAFAGAGFLTGLALLPLAAQRFGLLVSFLLLSGMSLLSALMGVVLVLTLRRERLRADPSWLQAAEGVAVVETTLPDGAGPIRKIVTLLLLSFFGLLAVDGLLGWLSAYLQLSLGYDMGLSSSILSIISLGYIAGAIAAGALSDLRGRMRILNLGSFALALFLPALALPHVKFTLIGLSVLIGLGMGFAIAPMTALASELFGAGRAGAATGVLVLGGQAAQFVSGAFFGYLVDQTGSFHVVWMVASLGLMIRVIAGVLLRPASIPGQHGVYGGRNVVAEGHPNG